MCTVFNQPKFVNGLREGVKKKLVKSGQADRLGGLTASILWTFWPLFTSCFFTPSLSYGGWLMRPPFLCVFWGSEEALEAPKISQNSVAFITFNVLKWHKMCSNLLSCYLFASEPFLGWNAGDKKTDGRWPLVLHSAGAPQTSAVCSRQHLFCFGWVCFSEFDKSDLIDRYRIRNKSK